MGIITDKDANEAEEAVDLDFPYIKKSDKYEFLQCFVEAWRKSKSGKFDITSQDVLKYLNAGIENDPENFGKAFGVLLGSIEFNSKEPEKFLQPSVYEWIVLEINALKSKPHFYLIAMKRIDALSEKIKLEELTQEQRKSFGTLIANLK